jgi:hypothetical protein
MRYLDVSLWVDEIGTDVPWVRLVNVLELQEPTAFLFAWKGMYFLAHRAFVANAMDRLKQKTTQAKNPLPEPSFALCDFLLVPNVIGRILADELRE